MIPGTTNTIGCAAPARVCSDRSIGTGSSSPSGSVLNAAGASPGLAARKPASAARVRSFRK